MTAPERNSTPSIPPQLLPWQPWLAQLMPETSEFLARSGQLLRPLISGTTPASMPDVAQPIGVGGLSRRGDYSRLSMSDWLLADAAPEEFLRRAAMHELLFLAPEPEPVPHKPEIVLLFDTGPLQLGAPRLAHLALWIALARRAELIGAQLLWGSVQTLLERCQNGADATAMEHAEFFSTRVDALALDELAEMRSPRVLDAQGIGPLGPFLCAHAGAEFWWIGAALGGADLPDLLRLLPQEIRRKFRRIQIIENIAHARSLLVQLGAHTIALALPAALKAAEILRHPSKLREFKDASNAPQHEQDIDLIRLSCGPFSLQQPPLFSTKSDALLLAGLKEPVLMFKLARNLNTSQRLSMPKLDGRPIAIDLVGRRLSLVEQINSAHVGLRDFGANGASIPGQYLPVNQFPERALGLGMAQWRTVVGIGTWVYLLSQEKLYACNLQPKRPDNIEFHLIAEHVVKLDRHDGALFAVVSRVSPSQPEQTIHRINSGVLEFAIAKLAGAIDTPFQMASGEWLYPHADGRWLIGSTQKGWRELPWRLHRHESAIGVAMRGTTHPQLCVQERRHFRFLPLGLATDLDSDGAPKNLHRNIPSFGAVLHAELSPNGANLAWLTQERELRVYSFSRGRLILRCAGQSQTGSSLDKLPENPL